jgi:hypothetical protein
MASFTQNCSNRKKFLVFAIALVGFDAIARLWYNASGICKTTISAIFFLDELNNHYFIVYNSE